MKKIVLRSLVCFVTLIALLAAILLSLVLVFHYGPSPRARNLFVNSMLETSAAKFLATWFFSEEELAEIVRQNSVEPTDEITDPGLITPEQPTEPAETAPPDIPASSVISSEGGAGESGGEYIREDGIEISDISTPLYKGKLMVISDPARVSIGISGKYGEEHAGKKLTEIAADHDAVAAVNGGGFLDVNGTGNGGIPLGLVISEGELLWGMPEETYQVIGFNRDNVLIVGYMTAQRALDLGMRDALSFGPILIVNGNKATINGSGSGLNPRTAIGQRADGAILLLVIDGRQASSLGASLGDLADILYSHGAVNAANLDGGNSSAMYYKGKIINNCVSLILRDMPTTVIVK